MVTAGPKLAPWSTSTQDALIGLSDGHARGAALGDYPRKATLLGVLGLYALQRRRRVELDVLEGEPEDLNRRDQGTYGRVLNGFNRSMRL